MNRFFCAFILLSIGIVACATGTPRVQTADDYVKEFGGNVDVYRTILALEDCGELQVQFDTAYDNSLRDAGTPKFKWSEGYMTAANNRMKEIACTQ